MAAHADSPRPVENKPSVSRWRLRPGRLRQRLLLLGLISCGLLYMLSFWSQTKPTNLGVHSGQLAPCPNSPNCVSTTAERSENQMTPWAMVGDLREELDVLMKVISDLPRTEIVTAKDNYLHVQCTSLVFRFVDDVEFLVDENSRTIHFRSASRVGFSDMGVNRRRMDLIKKSREQVLRKQKLID